MPPGSTLKVKVKGQNPQDQKCYELTMFRLDKKSLDQKSDVLKYSA